MGLTSAGPLDLATFDGDVTLYVYINARIRRCVPKTVRNMLSIQL